jgi:hypothetical protein
LFVHIAIRHTIPSNLTNGHFFLALMAWDLSCLPAWAQTVPIEARFYGTAFVFEVFCIQKTNHSKVGLSSVEEGPSCECQ